MLSKNNTRMQNLADQQPHYGLVKLSIGLVSALLGINLVYTAGHADSVDSANSASPNTEMVTVGGTIKDVGQGNAGESTLSTDVTAQNSVTGSNQTSKLAVMPSAQTDSSNTANTNDSGIISSAGAQQIFANNPMLEPKNVNSYVKEQYDSENHDLRDPYFWKFYNDRATPEGYAKHQAGDPDPAADTKEHPGTPWYSTILRGMPLVPVPTIGGLGKLDSNTVNSLMSKQDSDPASTKSQTQYLMNTPSDFTHAPTPFSNWSDGSISSKITYASLSSGNLELAGITHANNGQQYKYHFVIVGKCDDQGNYTSELFRVKLPYDGSTNNGGWAAWFPIINNDYFKASNFKGLAVVDRLTNDPYGNYEGGAVECWITSNGGSENNMRWLGVAKTNDGTVNSHGFRMFFDGYLDGLSLDVNTGMVHAGGWISDSENQQTYKYARYILHDKTTNTYIPMDVKNSVTPKGFGVWRNDLFYRRPMLFNAAFGGYDAAFDTSKDPDFSILHDIEILQYWSNNYDPESDYKAHLTNYNHNFGGYNKDEVKWTSNSDVTDKDGNWTIHLRVYIPIQYRDKATNQKISPDSVAQVDLTGYQNPDGNFIVTSIDDVSTTHDGKASALKLDDGLTVLTQAKQIPGYKISESAISKSGIYITDTSHPQSGETKFLFDNKIPYFVNRHENFAEDVQKYLNTPDNQQLITFYYDKDPSMLGLKVKVVDDSLDGRVLDTYTYAGHVNDDIDLSNIKFDDSIYQVDHTNIMYYNQQNKVDLEQTYKYLPKTFTMHSTINGTDASRPAIVVHLTHKSKPADLSQYKPVTANILTQITVNWNHAIDDPDVPQYGYEVSDTQYQENRVGRISLNAQAMVDAYNGGVNSYQLTTPPSYELNSYVKLHSASNEWTFDPNNSSVKFTVTYDNSMGMPDLAYKAQDVTYHFKDAADAQALINAVNQNDVVNYLQTRIPGLLSGDMAVALDPADVGNDPDGGIWIVSPQIMATLNFDHVKHLTGNIRYIDMDTGNVVGMTTESGLPNSTVKIDQATIKAPDNYTIVPGQILPTSVSFGSKKMRACDILVQQVKQSIDIDPLKPLPTLPGISYQHNDFYRNSHRTINVYDNNGKLLKSVVQTVSFVRNGRYNVNTKQVTYGDWQLIGNNQWLAYHPEWQDGMAVDSAPNVTVTPETTDTEIDLHYRPLYRDVTINYLANGKVVSSVVKKSIPATLTYNLDFSGNVPKGYKLATTTSTIDLPVSQNTVNVLVEPSTIILDQHSSSSQLSEANIALTDLVANITRTIRIQTTKNHYRMIKQKIRLVRNVTLTVENGNHVVKTFGAWKAIGADSFNSVYIPKHRGKWGHTTSKQYNTATHRIERFMPFNERQLNPNQDIIDILDMNVVHQIAPGQYATDPITIDYD